MNDSTSKADSLGSPALDILYQDDALVAVHKPEGLLVHKSNIDKHETQFLLQRLRDQIGCFLYPVHRLDKPTSGVIVFAKSSAIAALIKRQMEENTASKDYLLICRGFCPEQGVIDHDLKPIDDFKRKRGKPLSANPRADKPGQKAITHFKRLNTAEVAARIDRYPTSRFSLVKARLITGRKHQLRRHFKHLSHPIIGCPKYGKSNYNHYFANHYEAGRLLLHAYQLALDHPVTGQRIVVSAPLVGSFKTVVERLGWSDCLTAV
ncbi:MAG TPA: pseudouridine synthase [Marinagarivorans sp.]